MIKIKGGRSGVRSISFESAEFCSKASVDSSGQIRVVVGKPNLWKLAVIIMLVFAALMMAARVFGNWFAISCMVSIGWYLKMRVSPWHGAEHMVEAAYSKTGRLDWEEIKSQDRVNPLCGARFILPGLLIIFGAQYLSTVIQIFPNEFWWAGQGLGIYGVFVFDKKIGFNDLPIFSQSSRLIQKYLTTAAPGELELKVAKRAMEGLIDAHENS